MKLSYRGVSYQSEPSTLEVSEGEIGGTYRGHSWKVHRIKHNPWRKSPANMTYRGVTYKRG
ncbi:MULTISPECIES: DUF4278 domain-containing protein [Moorena]|uniref:DUF4278 domain-containing protein n=2 Tax=Moorena producens TaxID=1155739 RepID=A0A1D9G0R8_MOOP1|nr:MULTISPECIES: DUF4278 domain-containing protein [Moorena]NEP48068.1 DUF4278 domain-containing protein [Moorena sp. SIO3C2]NEQ15411.1 DUF4278 domain-containing protein [Moorena sp. SIO3E2]AOY81010.1 DUF4278 domain-containing protein [Moorena producens JHB]EGJ31044.1 hypothetical protein LYNGBM3L_43010 [Moorena producens 3L]NEP33410.1 DUF4278 domain-containing protein [Moorena sp. SIO3B2]